MPAYSRSFIVQSGHRLSACVALGSVLAFASACNGQTAFVENSRVLQRELTVAASDADSRARTSKGARDSSDGGEPVAGKSRASSADDGASRPADDRAGGASPGSSDSADPADGVADGIDEQRRPVPPDHAQTPSLPKDNDSANGPVADVPSQAQPATPPQAQPENPPQPPVPPQAQPATPPQAQPTPPPSQQPQPRAGEWVNVELSQPRAKVDILWVVDSSGSMAWAQNQLKDKFQSFAQKLKDTRIDFQVGVTSVDVCQVDSSTGYAVPDALCPSASYIPDGVKVGGKIVGPLRGTLQADPVSKRSILRDTSDFVEAFQRTAMLGTKGSAFEHGLWAAKLAVEKALNIGTENQGFIRNDAALSVVVLSDEEDDSVQMWCEDAYGRTSLAADGKKDLNLCREGGRSPFLDAFGIAPYALMKTSKGLPVTTHKFTADQFKSWAANANVKGSGNFRVSAITGLRGQDGRLDCAMSNGPEESGTNYIKAAQLTGGAVENICSSDWSSVLRNIGQNTVELATRVSLPAGRIPYAGTLEVRVDGQVLNAMHYTYDSSLHAVVFKAPPAMGSEVIVSYRETLVD